VDDFGTDEVVMVVNLGVRGGIACKWIALE